VTATAHLVLWLDIESLEDPAAVKSAGIYESAKPVLGLRRGVRPVAVQHTTGRDYHEARLAMQTLIETDARYTWVRPMLERAEAN